MEDIIQPCHSDGRPPVSRSSSMKIRQIKAFLAVVSTGGVRPAANRLCLTPSTVAKSITQLESDLGAPLFERSAMGLRLNEAGRSLLPYAETIAANADRAAAAVTAAATGRLTKLSISVTPTLPPEVLVEAMARFRSRWPSVRLVFTSGFFSDCAPKLLSDKLDISLVMTSRYQHEELSALVEEPLFEVDHGIVAAPGHPVFAPNADLRRILTESKWLTTVQDESFLLEKLGALGIAPKSVTLCDFFGIDALKGRNGALSLSPLSVVEDSRYADRVRALDPARFPLPALTVSFFHRKAVELSPPADFMRHALREAFAQWIAERPRRFIRAL